jgi:hypothetical protein
MSVALKLNQEIDDEYYAYFLEKVERVKNNQITVEQIKDKLLLMEAKIDEWAEDSEFFDLGKAQKLLGWSEAILQDLPSYDEDVQWDLLGAILLTSAICFNL